MAKKILVNYDFTKNEAQNMRTHNLAAAPGSPGAGQRYYDTVLLSEYFWNGTAWVACDATLRTGIPIANLATNPLARANHTGTQLASTISDFSTAVQGVTNIPNSALATNPLARANHTGTQLASTISDFDTQVRTSRLDQMAAPTASVSLNSQKITNLAAPTASSNDAARIIDVENAVNSAAAGIDSKASVRAIKIVTTLAGVPSGLSAFDGVTPVGGDRILVVDSSFAANQYAGVYIAAAGSWALAPDSNGVGELTAGAFWFVEEGTTYNKTQWRCNTTGAITPGTTPVAIVQFGAANVYTGGAGLVLTGGDFAVGAGTGITVNADDVAINTSVVARKYAVSVGDGSQSSFTVTHNLNNQDALTQVREVSTNNVVECDIQNNGVNTVVVTFSPAVPTAGQYRVVVIG